MKRIEVVAGIIKDGDKIFATQRGYGEFKDGWEFPGGKMEVGETPQQALASKLLTFSQSRSIWYSMVGVNA